MGVGEKNKQFLIIITVANIIDNYGLNSRFIVKAEFEPLTKRSNWHIKEKDIYLQNVRSLNCFSVADHSTLSLPPLLTIDVIPAVASTEACID